MAQNRAHAWGWAHDEFGTKVYRAGEGQPASRHASEGASRGPSTRKRLSAERGGQPLSALSRRAPSLSSQRIFSPLKSSRSDMRLMSSKEETRWSAMRRSAPLRRAPPMTATTLAVASWPARTSSTSSLKTTHRSGGRSSYESRRRSEAVSSVIRGHPGLNLALLGRATHLDASDEVRLLCRLTPVLSCHRDRAEVPKSSTLEDAGERPPVHRGARAHAARHLILVEQRQPLLGTVRNCKVKVAKHRVLRVVVLKRVARRAP